MARKQTGKANSILMQVLGGFGLIAGATYPFRSLLVWIENPRLLNFVWVPIWLNVGVGIALYAGLLFPGLNWIDGAIASLSVQLDSFIASLPTWLSFIAILDNFLGIILRVLLVGLLLIATGFLIVQFGAILGAPWYGQLSEQLELLRVGKLPAAEPLTPFSIARDIWRSLMFEVKKIVLAAILGGFLVPLYGIPGVGTVAATIGGVAIAAIIVCLDFLDAPLERRRLRFRRKLAIVLRALPASASFAVICLILISIPLLNLLAVPLCVASGTLFFCDRIWPKFRERN